MKDNPVVYVVMSTYDGDTSLEEVFIQESEAKTFVNKYRGRKGFEDWKFLIERKQTS